jgi:hypothetical protein
MAETKGRIHLERRSLADLSDQEIDRLVNFGRAEADLINQLVEASRDGDRDLAWRVVQEFRRIEDEIEAMAKPRGAPAATLPRRRG